jgi:pimeloyl-ACP methyl ester carboxylesterase
MPLAGLPPLARVAVDGRTLAYRRAGSGPPLVLLHGGLADSRQWVRQFAAFATAFDVVAWDAPGTGGSDDPPEDFRLPDYADALAGLIDALGLERPHVGGLSFGGGLAIQLFDRRPSLPRSLVLASAYAGWAGSLVAHEVEGRLEAALRAAEVPPDLWIPDLLDTLLTPAAPAGIAEELTAMLSDVRPAGIRTTARAFAEADLRDVLPRIDVPVLLLHGDQDVRAPRYVADALHQAIAGSELVVIPGAGHELDLEAPEAFNSAVASFLASVQPPGDQAASDP